MKQVIKDRKRHTKQCDLSDLSSGAVLSFGIIKYSNDRYSGEMLKIRIRPIIKIYRLNSNCHEVF